MDDQGFWSDIVPQQPAAPATTPTSAPAQDQSGFWDDITGKDTPGAKRKRFLDDAHTNALQYALHPQTMFAPDSKLQWGQTDETDKAAAYYAHDQATNYANALRQQMPDLDEGELSQRALKFRTDVEKGAREGMVAKAAQEQAPNVGRLSDEYLQSRMPFLHYATDYLGSNKLGDATDNYAAGKATRQDYDILGRHFALKNQEADRGFGGKALDVATGFAPLAGEMYATGGAGAAGEGAVAAGLEAGLGQAAKGTLGRLTARLLGQGLGRAAAIAPLSLPAAYARGASSTPGMSPTGEIQVSQGSTGAGFDEAAKQFAGDVVDNGMFNAGGLLSKPQSRNLLVSFAKAMGTMEADQDVKHIAQLSPQGGLAWRMAFGTPDQRMAALKELGSTAVGVGILESVLHGHAALEAAGHAVDGDVMAKSQANEVIKEVANVSSQAAPNAAPSPPGQAGTPTGTAASAYPEAWSGAGGASGPRAGGGRGQPLPATPIDQASLAEAVQQRAQAQGTPGGNGAQPVRGAEGDADRAARGAAAEQGGGPAGQPGNAGGPAVPAGEPRVLTPAGTPISTVATIGKESGAEGAPGTVVYAPEAKNTEPAKGVPQGTGKGMPLIRLVDEEQLRDRSRPDEEFGNVATHNDLSHIPENEIWIGKNVRPEEHGFLRDFALARDKAMAGGMSKEKAEDYAADIEAHERERASGVKKSDKPRPVPPEIYKGDIGIQDGNRIKLVDAKKVRDTFETEFVEGGNHSALPFIPKGEVWIADDVKPEERPFIIQHELTEHNLMEQGASYHEAHHKASEAEYASREAGQAPTQPEGAPAVNEFRLPSGPANLQKSLRKAFAPATVGPTAEFSAGILRRNLGEEARDNAVRAAAVQQYHDKFDNEISREKDPQLRRDKFLQFMDPIQRGKISSMPPDVQPIAQAMRDGNDAAEKELTKRGILKTTVANYFGQLWKDPKNPNATPEEIAAKLNARRPFAGRESFKKQRTYESYREGLDAGLEPISWNPVDLYLAKAKEVNKSIMAHDSVEEFKDAGLWKFFKLGDRLPTGWKYINDKLGKVFAPPKMDVKQYVDKQQTEGLEDFARSLGVKVQDTQGGSPGTSTPGGDITRRYFTHEQVLAHEIGHQLDDKYGLQAKFRPEAQELQDLADTRASGNPTQEYQDYIRSDPEKIANLVAGYVHAPDLTKRIAPNAYDKLDKFLQSDPTLSKLRDVKPSLELGEREQAMRLAGPMLTGNYAAPEELANLLDRHLSPGLRGNAIYDTLNKATSTLNLFNLGWSAFHATGTAINAQISTAALGLKMMSRGDFAQGLKKLAMSPAAPFTAFMDGTRTSREYYKPGSEGAEYAAKANAITTGGGRAAQQNFDTSSIQQFRSAVKDAIGGDATGAAKAIAHALPALTEWVSTPIMGMIVPRMKIGVFNDIAKYEIEKLGPNPTQSMTDKALQDAWNSVDNRMGQMVHDNNFWNRTFKDIAQISIRSLGWNLGTMRELGGGVADIPSSLKGLTTGQGISNRLAYSVALPAVTAAYGAMLSYLYGQKPESLKDYFFPRTGDTRKDGTADRVELPTYMRDVASLTNRADEGPLRILRNAGSMAKNKLSPLIGLTSEILSNEDFYGKAITNPNDPWGKQVLDVAKHAGKSGLPLSVRSFLEQREAGASAGKSAIGFLGLTQAPGYITKTAEEQRAQETKQKVYLTPLAKKIKEESPTPPKRRSIGTRIRTTKP